MTRRKRRKFPSTTTENGLSEAELLVFQDVKKEAVKEVWEKIK